ncbi:MULTISPECIES: antirestriction protein ArdA [unclassified Dehalobacter]|uniref:antirestriction protein ArdA n=1 Tax=unclassified Dehalobacter TaxID=2635733 RepID=UPI000E6CE87E|nr:MULTISPECIES: antirestriction protein ArdA [unclassified Dehalobacter]RJE46596.1 hypothetical protein A7K50_12580 [Dehalobacter sp. MCB1]TCX47364.1 hypothetical protein C1I36_13740 [Dehalobacter sp. 14DCB1]TCX55577.1 hypothetical protein C1I38_02705 [Dehalobacter sp. 12DCB1]
MNKDRENNSLPQKCYAVLSFDGRLVTITQGTTGFFRSPLDQGDRSRNRAIADKENKELGGVTPEQENAMITGAIFGWEFAGMTAGSPAKPDRIFELEISRPCSFGANTSATLTLPATPYEILDALDKARVIDERVIYSMEITSCKLDYLPQFLSPSTNLYELNHLAQRLAALSEWELDCFEGMVMMDTVHTDYAPIAVERLINMTHSTADCQVVYEAHDNESLGKFYEENGFVPELETLPEKVFPWLDYGKIGKEMHDGEGGVFTPSGYVVQNGEIAQTYQSGDAILTEKPDYTVLLHVTKRFFEAPGDDQQLSAVMEFPASETALQMAMSEVDAIVPEECGFIAVDCIVPRLTEKITDALEYGNLDTVRDLSAQLQRLNDEGGIPAYKAMLESAPKDIALEDALDLAYQAGEFRLLREIASPEDYAKAELAKCTIPLKAELLSQNFYRYGEKLMERNKAVSTDYGILFSPSGQTVEQCLVRPGRHMEMGGQA